MSLQSFFPIITSTTIAITTTLLGCTIAQAATLNGGQKLQAISTLAYSQNVFFLGGFAENNSSVLNSSNVTFTPESLIFNSSSQLGDLLFTSTYNSNYDSNSDTVTWTQLGVLGNQSWSSSGTVSFLDDNETIIWNSDGSINPDIAARSSSRNWSVGFVFQLLGGQRTINIFGNINDNLGKYGSYNADVGITYDGNGNSWEGFMEGKIFKTIGSGEIGVGGKVKFTPTGNTTGSIEPYIEPYITTPVPEPLTILGAGVSLGFGALFKKEYFRNQKKVKSLEKQKA